MKFVIVIVALCAAVLSTIALPTPAPQRNEDDVGVRILDIVGVNADIPTIEILPGKTKLHL
jgi:hypothetical protein